LNPELAAKIYGENPGIMNIHSMIKFTPNQNKSGLITNLFKYDSFINKLIPFGFSNFFNQVDNKDSISAIVIKSPTFLEKMNRYSGALSYTLEEMISASNYKDKLIEALLAKDGLIEMLDEDGAKLLIQNHSNPDMVEEKIMDVELGGDEWEDFEDEEPAEDERELAESIKLMNILGGELNKIFPNKED
jgi:hypothetical protein